MKRHVLPFPNSSSSLVKRGQQNTHNVKEKELRYNRCTGLADLRIAALVGPSATPRC